MKRCFRAVPRKGIVSSTVLASATRIAQDVFDATKSFVQEDWPLQIDEPGFIAWVDDSGDGLRTLDVRDIQREMSGFPEDCEAEEIGLECAEVWSLGSAIRIFKKHGKEVPDWLLDELDDM